MPVSTLNATSAAPDQAVRFLCRHFEHGHAVPVSVDAGHGLITLPDGLLFMSSGMSGAIDIRLEAADAVAIGELERLVERHLARFSLCELPLPGWSRQT